MCCTRCVVWSVGGTQVCSTTTSTSCETSINERCPLFDVCKFQLRQMPAWMCAYRKSWRYWYWCREECQAGAAASSFHHSPPLHHLVCDRQPQPGRREGLDCLRGQQQRRHAAWGLRTPVRLWSVGAADWADWAWPGGDLRACCCAGEPGDTSAGHRLWVLTTLHSSTKHGR